MPRVRLYHPAEGTQTAEIGATAQVVGRPGVQSQIQFSDSGLSRRHGQLWAEGEDVWYEDLGSSNGSWAQGERLQAKLRLQPGVEVRLGPQLLLSLDPDEGLPPGMEVCMEGEAGGGGLSSLLTGPTTYISALYEMVDRLLGASGVAFIPEVIGRLQREIPAAGRIALVAWPPREDGGWHELVPSGSGASFVSRSLARYAVERGKALLLADWSRPTDLEMPFSAVMQGIRNAFYIPLVAEDATFGVFCVDSPNAELALTPEHFQFVCAVAGLLATTLAAERLREEARAKEAARAGLAAFLQIASHDLKNPLNSIANGARLLTVARPEQHPPLVAAILKASNRATDLIKTYLDVAEVESGKALVVDWSSLACQAVIEEEVEDLRGALSFSHPLTVSAPAEPVRADERKFRQIVTNLVSNAVKYSPAGGAVFVTAAVSQGVLKVEVKDQGTGISSADQARLFQAFQRVGDVSLAPGTGLGLWITAALVAAMGGQIGVASEPGQGSLFWFTIPQGQGES